MVASSAVAQTPAPSPAPSLERQFFKNLFKDQKAIWTSPFHLRMDDVRWLTPLSIGTAGFISTDRRVGDAVGTHPQWLRGARGVSEAGTGPTVAGAAVAFYVIGRATHNDRLRETGLLSFEAFINSEIVVGVVKGAMGRSRPVEGEDRSQFFTGGTSFPSGHTIQIWSMATVVAHEYHDRRWVPITAYAIAGAVGAARVAAQRHYPSDVLVGGALGYLIGRYVYRTHHVEPVASAGAVVRTPLRTWPLIAPTFDRRAGAYGLRLSWAY